MATSKTIRLDLQNGGAVEVIETATASVLLVWERPRPSEDAPRDRDVWDITDGLPGESLL
jgi:hypothetical protein